MTAALAVIGSGMAGLAAAYRARKAGYQVTLFEAHDGLGMDAHAVPAHGALVDVPLRVMSPEAWRSVLALAAELGVETFRVDTDVSCSGTDQATWFTSARMPLTGWPLPGSWRHLHGKSLRLGRGMLQLSASLRKPALPAEATLAEYLQQQQFDPLFWRGLVLPLLSTICTCSEEYLLAWPAQQLLDLLQYILHGSRLQRLQGGTGALVSALSQDLKRHCGSAVQQVSEQADGVLVRNGRGEGGLFERVIVATQANQLDLLQGSDFAAERAVLAGIPYDHGELVVHSDQRFMPARRSDWVALNFQSDSEMRQPMFTVWVNAVEPALRGAPPVFQTWNPLYAPDPQLVLASVSLQRAVVCAGTAAILQQLEQWHRRPGRRVFYCGSWAHEGVPLLETAVRSAERVVALLPGKA